MMTAEARPSFRVLCNDKDAVVGFSYNHLTFMVAGNASDNSELPLRTHHRVRETVVDISRRLRGLIQFHAKQWVHVPDYGAVAECDWPDETLTIWEVVDQKVLIDDLTVTVMAVEHHELDKGVPLEAVGLAVESITCCTKCTLPQFKTPSGVVCPNGHTGGE